MSKNSNAVYNNKIDELIDDNMGLVISIVNKFNPVNETQRQDMIDAGRIGLWKGLEKYNIEIGWKISTFVWRPIRWSIIKEIRNIRYDISINNIVEPSGNTSDNLWEYLSDNLSTEELEIIELRKLGYKFREISEVLNKSPSIIKNTFYRAIKKIAKEYNET
jgi:RNA polymerase sigma factor (sigma-70 family)